MKGLKSLAQKNKGLVQKMAKKEEEDRPEVSSTTAPGGDVEPESTDSFQHADGSPVTDSEATSEEASQNNLKIVAKALMGASGSMKRWGPGDLTLGLYYLKKDKRKKREAAEEAAAAAAADLETVTDPATVANLLFWSRLIEGTYKMKEADLLEYTGIAAEHLIATDFTSTITKPGHYLAVIPEKKAVLLAIRGTKTVSDALTDLTMSMDDFKGGKVHTGIHEASKWFVANRKKDLDDALAANPGFEVVTVGHSLGGGTAALTALILRDQGVPVRSVVIAPACAMSLDLATECKDFITTVVHRDDVISRISVVAVDNLRNELQEFPWKDHIKDNLKANKLVSNSLAGKNSVAGSKFGLATGKAKNNMTSSVKSQTGKMKKGKEEEDGEEGTPDDEVEPAEVNLYPPGVCYHLFKVEERYKLKEVDIEFFSDIELSDFMLPDHSSGCYLAGLEDVQSQL